ncbi:MAG: hypothetical protein QOG76_2603, partial [Pseudonocardiales bacterium]|nr:hypothetical protein [Pseudonocardiales bacterium]
ITPRDTLLQLQAPNRGMPSGLDGGPTRTGDSRKGFGTLPQVNTRPLGPFSDYICEQLGTDNAQVRERIMSGGELLEIADHKLSMVRDCDFDLLMTAERERDRRLGEP